MLVSKTSNQFTLGWCEWQGEGGGGGVSGGVRALTVFKFNDGASLAS